MSDGVKTKLLLLKLETEHSGSMVGESSLEG